MTKICDANPPTISVVIPTFNRGSILSDAINSALSQTTPPREIIVVDDGSTDNTAEVLARFGEKITLIHQPNSGVSAARNAGIEQARGDWIAFLDSDDVWRPDRVAILLQDIAGTDAGVHVANLEITGPGYEQELFRLRKFYHAGPWPLRHEDGFEFASHELMFLSSIAVRRDWILKAGGFDVTIPFYEDIDFLYRMILFGPWLANAAVVVSLRRIDTVRGSLSSQFRDNQIFSDGIKIKIYERLLRSLPLESGRSKTIRRKLSKCRFDTARALNIAGQYAEEKGMLFRSAREHPGIKGWLRALPPLLISTSGYRLVELARPRGFYRDKI